MRLFCSLLFFPVAISGLSFAQERNELIPLRLKAMERPDRLPEKNEPNLQITGIKTDLNLPVPDATGSWPGEVFSSTALDQLNQLVKSETQEEIAEIIASDFRANRFESDTASKTIAEGVTLRSGSEGKLTPVSPTELLKRIRALDKVKVKITEAGDRATRVHVEANRKGAEYSATWNCQWSNDSPPRLLSLNVEKFETVLADEQWFIDATSTVIGSNPKFDAQVLHGIDYWAQRITRIGDLSMSGHHGLAVGDVNGDGLEDLYVCDGGSLPNQLYLQQADGTAKEVAIDWGVAWLEDSRSALLIDLDNDGDQDLVVATIAMIAFAENVDNQGFELRGGFPGAPYPFSMSAADYDSDGDLDIYTCIYSAGDQPTKRGFEASSPIPFNDAENGGRNILLSNLGNFQFSDVTRKAGLDQNNTRWSFAASWEDYDRDGDPDLYVANDFGRNCFYRNDQGKFTDIAKESGVEDMAAGMSVSWGDSNRDGASDLFVGNMFSSAGQRVSFQRNYESGKKRMARGNTLFTATETGFKDASISSGITNGGWAWSSGFADLNNDGWQDLVVSNGYLSNSRDNDL
ncbi:VCBS repeat-containing protein [Akkermansiaceae bacterium]|jgi:hypothetical protein|nr:VCBS repeat-containing protein [Akkermansiaceae bacterium]